ncbi:MAG: EamA family transporter [Pseudomonadota bacterium]
MDLVWIPIAVAAGFFQAVRTAAQKAVNAHLSTWMTTYVRSLWGLPFLIAYLAIVVSVEGADVPTVPVVYWLHVAGCALTQVLATWVLIRLFQRSNFAVGTILTKTDVMQAALIGSLLFSETISVNGAFAILLSVLGVLLVSGRQAQGAFQRLSIWQALSSVSTGLGLLTGFLFCLSYLFLREAALVMPEGSGAYRGAWTVVAVTSLQAVGLGLYLAVREPNQFYPMLRQWRPCAFIGLTSAAGSIGWFTAMAMQNASYVKAVGQTEVIFTILISTFYFRETISPREYVGIAAIVASVVILAF